MSKLRVIQNDHEERPRGRILTAKIRERASATRALLDRKWLERPDAMRTPRARQRISATVDFLGEQAALTGLRTLDLGCGTGEMARALVERGAQVLAVDISGKALSLLRERCGDLFEVRQDCIPHTNLEDDSFDLVISTDVIGDLDAREYRLYITELYRLVKPTGKVLCSSPVDVHSDEALPHFVSLFERDFVIEGALKRHDRLLIHLLDICAAPRRFARAAKEATYRKRKLEGLAGIRHWWWKLHTSAGMGKLWGAFTPLSSRAERAAASSERLRALLERLSAFVWHDRGVSHMTLLGRRRKLGE